MNFVFVSYNYNANCNSPEAWFKQVKFYVGSLESLSKKHTVHRIEQINYYGDSQHNGIQYHFINLRNKHTRFPIVIHRLVKELNPDVVVVHGLHNPLRVIQLHLLLNNKVKIIVQNHAEKPAVGIRKLLQKLADQYIDAYWFASRDMGMDWVAKGNLKSGHKIHEVMEVSSSFYPIDKVSAKARTGVQGKPVFLWVGRLNDNKDPLNVVKTFVEFVKACSTAKLYMIYHTGELLNDIKAILNKAGVPKSAINLVGKVPHEDLLYWYNSADFIISGSFYEGSGTAVCEAMSCGCVPLVTDIFSFRAITDNGDCGMLYEAGNQKELLSVLMQTQQMDLDEKRRKALKFFKDNLSFEAIAKRMELSAISL
jgi:glycosyltransferase involved in cell wall biosynthesis